MKLRLRLLLASVLAALTSGPTLVLDWLPPGRYGPLPVVNHSGTAVIGQVWFHVEPKPPHSTVPKVAYMVFHPASPPTLLASPPTLPGGKVEFLLNGPKGRTVLMTIRNEATDRATIPTINAGPGVATLIEWRPGPSSFPPVPWKVIGEDGSAALAFVCTVIANCPDMVRNLQAARRGANRRPIGFRLALPLLVVIPLLSYALSRRILVIEPAHAQPDPQSDTDRGEIVPPTAS